MRSIPSANKADAQLLKLRKKKSLAEVHARDKQATSYAGTRHAEDPDSEISGQTLDTRPANQKMTRVRVVQQPCTGMATGQQYHVVYSTEHALHLRQTSRQTPPGQTSLSSRHVSPEKDEEKQQALDAESSIGGKNQENEATLKQLRKSLLFNANPIPSFYHEGPPPKVAQRR